MDGFLEVADARLTSGPPTFTIFQLTSAVLVAEYLRFEALRAYAVRELENVLGELNPIACMEDVMKCHDKAWVLRPLSRLCLTKKPFSWSESLRVSLPFAVAIYAIREGLDGFRSSLSRKFVLRDVPEPPMETVLWTRAQEPIKRHPVFTFLDVGDVEEVEDSKCVLVERCPSTEYRPVAERCYEVPLHYLRGASELREVANSNEWEIRLPRGVSTSDWETYLKVLTARPYDDPKFRPPFSSWMDTLRFAATIGHDDMQKYILDQLRNEFADEDSVSLIEASVIANTPSDSWVERQYKRLIGRVKP